MADTTAIPIGRADKHPSRWNSRAFLLLLPAYALLIGVFAYPLLESLLLSVTDPTFGDQNYRWLFGDPNNIRIIWRTFTNAALAMIICLVLAYPYAYLMLIVGKKARTALIIIALIPFWTSLMIRTFAWIVLLQDTGLINSFLQAIGLPQMELIRTNTGVMIGLTQVLMPFMVLPLYSVMSGIDMRLVTAARSLGASPAAAFFKIFLPLTIPGIAAGSLLVFIQALGFYVTPALLGSPRDSMLAQAIYTQVSGLLDWGRGGAFGVILLVCTLIVLAAVALIAKIGRKRGMAVKVF
ncbi:ABC transporter permease [Canibacter zhoujuaniae]|uniref:ABC transporter permease n=1 Tax=Canibacter zhoujuaniae TaxID=2708343 RepID=UPI001423232A|nr:ABC transporter permease [Canibacter zhoujuaniae]